ncbi:MAG: GNAT family N-acetyltransferase [Melioribacteraceae bacterium]
MNKILETNRLVLREFENSDAENMFELNSDREVIKYTGDKPFESIKQAKYFLSNYSDYKKNGFGRWAVIEKETNNFIGWCGLKSNEDSFVDIGFRFLRRFWGKGYATESAKACLDYGFQKLNLNEIVGRANKENNQSICVLEKIDMSFWKNGSCCGDKSAVYYRINKTQFETKSFPPK